jgi:molybdopterin molybdotransferase
MNHPTLSEVVSCLSGYDPDAVPVAQAQQIIRSFVTPLHAVEKVAIRSALGRVLASDIVSSINVPAHDNSAMDGFAFAGAALKADEPTALRIVGTAYAGRAYDGPVAADECVRIMTGAVMPAGCDTVVPQEFTSQADTHGVMLPPNVVRTGDNRRLAGEDLAAGQPALAKGKILRPADLGLLASLGVAEVPVQRRLRVAFFSTGDELRSIGEPLDEGCVYDSNR